MKQYTDNCHNAPYAPTLTTLACGHNGVLRDHDDANTRVCLDCWRSEQIARNAGFDQKYDLPTLRGSHAQIAWASHIRRTMVTEVTGRITSAEINGKRPSAANKKTLTALLGIASAKAYIDGQDLSPEAFIAEFKRLRKAQQ